MAITLPHDAMVQLFGATPANDLPEVPDYNVCPTVPVHAVTSDSGRRHLRAMRWGFLPHWYRTPTDGPLLINARAETIAEKSAFREAVRARRCLIPASGFFEWTKDSEGARLPWYISRADGAPLVLAGLFQAWEQEGETILTCAVVTTAANDTMGRLHTRMPVVLEQADWALWLGEAGHGAALLMNAAAEDRLRAHRVGRAVNSSRARGAELIVPIEA